MTQQELKALLISKGVREEDIIKFDKDRGFYIISIKATDETEHEMSVGICEWEQGKVMTCIVNKYSGYFRFYEDMYSLSKTVGIYHALKS